MKRKLGFAHAPTGEFSVFSVSVRCGLLLASAARALSDAKEIGRMALGDFIGSLQFYPWRERMLMPEEESVERLQGDGWRVEMLEPLALAKSGPEGAPKTPRAGGHGPSQRSGRRRRPHRNGSKS
jgi:hypothetical protein